MYRFLSDVLSRGRGPDSGPVRDFKGEAADIPAGPGLSAGIMTFCLERDTEPGNFFLAALASLLYRYTWDEEITVTVAEGDKKAELTAEVAGEKSLGVLLESIGKARSMAEEALPDRDGRYNVLFVPDGRDCDSDGLAFNLCCGPVFIADSYVIRLQYDSGRIEKNAAENFGRQFLRLLEVFIENPDMTPGEADILPQAEKELLLTGFCSSGFFPSDRTVVDLFEEQAKRTPGKTAVISENGGISYERLNDSANKLANYLIKRGIGKETAVMLFMERSIAMIESILAIWKAGGAYIPADTAYPGERLRLIREEAGGPPVLTRSEYGPQSLFGDSGAPIVMLDEAKEDIAKESGENPNTRPAPGGLAYVIFTSGSTGKPKGAMIEHRGMLNHMFAKINGLKLDGGCIIANNASHCFDISVWQMFCPLILGGTTVIYTRDTVTDMDRFAGGLAEDGVTVLEVVPSFLSAMLERLERNPVRLPRLKHLLVTGEAMPPRLVGKWFEMFGGTVMVNAYGPTEASDDVAHYFMEEDPGLESIPIGRPVQNFKIYIADERMRLCPLGVTGEILVAGAGVGRGYLNNPEKTGEAFMEDPFSPHGGRLYKTGDLGRWTADGHICFLGRKDHQVKLRGFRIELGEIEAALDRHPSVGRSVAVVYGDPQGGGRIAAYFENRSGNAPGGRELRGFLAGMLPEYMLPAVFIPMDRLPLNSNGKIDRHALPAPDAGSGDAEKRTAPQTPMQKEITAIWEKLFGFSPIGMDDDFLELGGHSLLATQLAFRLNEHFGVSVQLRRILSEGRTIRTLTGVVEELLIGQMDEDEIKEMLLELEGLSEAEIGAMLEAGQVG